MKVTNKRLVTCSLRATPEMRQRIEELGRIHTRNISAQLEHMVKIADLVVGLLDTQELPKIESALQKFIRKTVPSGVIVPTAATEPAPILSVKKFDSVRFGRDLKQALVKRVIESTTAIAEAPGKKG